MTRIAGRRSLVQIIRENHAAEKQLAALAGVPVRADFVVPAEPRPRAPSAPRAADALKLEHTVQDEIIDYLKTRADVGLIERHNSGALKDYSGEHKFHVRFNTIYGKQDGEYMKKSDVQCTLLPNGRMCVIEVKREGWTGPNMNDDHERQQAAYITRVNRCGGLGFFAQSVEDVRRKLDAAMQRG